MRLIRELDVFQFLNWFLGVRLICANIRYIHIWSENRCYLKQQLNLHGTSDQDIQSPLLDRLVHCENTPTELLGKGE